MSFFPPWELQTPVSSLKAPDPSLLLRDPGLLINLPRNWFSQFFVTKCAVVHQSPLSMEFSRQEWQVGCHFLTRGSPWPSNKPTFPVPPAFSRQIPYHWATWEAQHLYYLAIFCMQDSISLHVTRPHLFQTLRWLILGTFYNLLPLHFQTAL